ncbi:MAG: hypothetical protein QM811_26645 [Pirellulales bacterium]
MTLFNVPLAADALDLKLSQPKHLDRLGFDDSHLACEHLEKLARSGLSFDHFEYAWCEETRKDKRRFYHAVLNVLDACHVAIVSVPSKTPHGQSDWDAAVHRQDLEKLLHEIPDK